MSKLYFLIIYLSSQILMNAFNIQNFIHQENIKETYTLVRKVDNMQEFSKVINYRFIELQGVLPDKHILEFKLNEYLSRDVICFIAIDETNNRIKGSCELILCKHHNAWYLRNLFTIKKFQKQGVATELLKKIIIYIHTTNCNKLYLEVHKNNDIAIKLYKNLGFKEIKQLDFFNNNNIKMDLKYFY